MKTTKLFMMHIIKVNKKIILNLKQKRKPCLYFVSYSEQSLEITYSWFSHIHNSDPESYDGYNKKTSGTGGEEGLGDS